MSKSGTKETPPIPFLFQPQYQLQRIKTAYENISQMSTKKIGRADHRQHQLNAYTAGLAISTAIHLKIPFAAPDHHHPLTRSSLCVDFLFLKLSAECQRVSQMAFGAPVFPDHPGCGQSR